MPRDRNAIGHRTAGRYASWSAVRRFALLAVILPIGALLAAWAVGHVAAGTIGRANAATSLKIQRADLHIDETATFPFELNVSISQMANNTCGAVLNGDYCLTYSVLKDEQTIQSGFGVIPATAVHLAATRLVLKLDTSISKSIHRLVGKGGPLSLSWTMTSSGSPVTTRNHTTQLYVASVQGSLVGYSLPGTHVRAGILFSVT